MFKPLTCLPLFASLCFAQSHKIAVIGLVHSHVWGHLGRMASNQPAQLVGIAEPNAELVAEAKKLAPEARYFSDYRQMLDEARPDIVWAFVENNRHLEIVQACAPRKVHVMFEKPLAATHKEALAIEQLAKRHGIQVMTNYQMAWWPTQYAARHVAASGELGKVWRLHGIVGHGGPGSTGVRSKYFFEWLTDPVRNGGGALVDFGCYNAIWALWYLGRPATVYAQANRLQPERFPRVEDNSTIVLTYPEGVAILEGSWDLPRGFQDLEVFGRQGSLYVTRDSVEVRKGKETTRAPVQSLPPERAEPIAYMVHCLRNNQPVEGMVGLPMNVQVLEILDAAKESISTGRAVRLPAR
ncbi:MAG: Gfo/Idh/MocA family protein [Bryobacteraceae bacterium]